MLKPGSEGELDLAARYLDAHGEPPPELVTQLAAASSALDRAAFKMLALILGMTTASAFVSHFSTTPRLRFVAASSKAADPGLRNDVPPCVSQLPILANVSIATPLNFNSMG